MMQRAQTARNIPAIRKPSDALRQRSYLRNSSIREVQGQSGACVIIGCFQRAADTTACSTSTDAYHATKTGSFGTSARIENCAWKVTHVYCARISANSQASIGGESDTRARGQNRRLILSLGGVYRQFESQHCSTSRSGCRHSRRESVNWRI